MIRMMDPNSGIVFSMIDGACREDYNQVPPELPFEIKLRTMVCYKTWKRTVIEIDQKLPVQILEEEDEEVEEEAAVEEEEKADEEEVSITDADLGLDSCWNVHPVVCADH